MESGFSYGEREQPEVLARDNKNDEAR
jgi:hypothetical protein